MAKTQFIVGSRPMSINDIEKLGGRAGDSKDPLWRAAFLPIYYYTTPSGFGSSTDSSAATRFSEYSLAEDWNRVNLDNQGVVYRVD